MSEELKACPGCAGPALIATENAYFYATCQLCCGFRTSLFTHESFAVAAWNRRAETPGEKLAAITLMMIDAPPEEAAKLEDRGKSALSAYRASRTPAKGGA